MDSFLEKQIIKSWRKETIGHVYTLINNVKYDTNSLEPILPYIAFVEGMKSECVGDNREYNSTGCEVIFMDLISSIPEPNITRWDLMENMIEVINKCENIRFMELFCNVAAENPRSFLTHCSLERKKNIMMNTIEEKNGTIDRLKEEKSVLEKKLKEKECSCETFFCNWMTCK